MNPETYTLKKSIELYNSVGLQIRNMSFLASWVHNVYKELFYLPIIDLAYDERLALDKTKLSIFAILVDDLADNYKLRNQELLENAIRIPWNPNEKYQSKYLEVTRKIWLDVMRSIKQYPRYNEFKGLFYFDMDQFLDSIRYAFLVNTMEIDNALEFKIYSHHNMMIIVYLDMDLMCSPDFNKEELWKLRPIFHYVQDICHIGNILSTYPRELEERDFSSPIISIGLRKGLITKDDILRNPKKATEGLRELESYYKRRVKENFNRIEKSADKIESVDIKEFSKKLRRVFKCFLERKHYWEE